MQKKIVGKKLSTEIESGSGNVFRDLDLPNSEEIHTKLMLAIHLNERISANKLSTSDVARLFGIPKTGVAALRHYRLDNFSSPILLTFFNALDFEVDILIRPALERSQGEFRVLFAG